MQNGFFRGVVVLALGGVLVASVANAGQMHVREYGLREVLERGGPLVAGIIKSRSGSGRKIEIAVQIDRIWRRAEGIGGPVVGAARTYVIYPGVEWTDPHKSMLDDRLRGGLSAEQAKPGQRVLVVPSMRSEVELLLVDAALIRRLDLLIAADPKKALAKEGEAALRADLADPDLAELARAELGRRGKLDGAALIGADPQFFEAQFRALDLAAQQRFLAEGITLARRDRRLRDRLATVVLREPPRALLPALAPLVALFNPRVTAERDRLEEFRIELLNLLDAEGATLDLSGYVDFLFFSVRDRPQHRSDDPDFAKLTRHLDQAGKARLAFLLLDTCARQNRAGKEVDGLLLDEAIRLAQEAPSAALIPPFLAFDPDRPQVLSEKEGLMSALLVLVLPLMRAFPAEVERLRDRVDVLLDRGIPAGASERAAYQAAIGAMGTKPAREVGIELSLGQARRLDDGMRVSLRKSDGAQDLRFVVGALDETRSILPGDDGYREWWIAPYLVVVSRAGNKVKLHLTPQAAEPREVAGDALYEQAKQLSERRGCPDYIDHDHDSYNGRFRYRARGPKGKRCSALIGGRTKKVVLLAP